MISRLLSVCCPICLHSIAFVFSCVRSLALFSPPFSFFFFSSLFTNFFFSFCLFLIQFFVSECFSYGGVMMFLWFLMYCILSVLSCLIDFLILPSLFSLIPFFAFHCRWLSPRLLFFWLFSFCAFKLLLFCLFGFFRIFKSICSPVRIFLLLSISFCPSLYLTLSDFFSAR